MPLIIKSEQEENNSPHLALCHEAQGFSANKRHVSLLMKSDATITDDVLKAFESLGIVDVHKAGYYRQTMQMLQSAVQENYGDKDSWTYVEDYNDTSVVFCTDSEMYVTNYTMTDGKITLDPMAKPVTVVISYSTSDGEMLLSEDAEDKLEEGVYSLVTKTLNNKTTQEHLIKVFKEKAKINQKEVEILEQEIKKAVEAAEAILKAQLKEKEEQLTKALQEVEVYKNEKAETVAKARKAAIASVEKDETEAEELFKSLNELSDEAFERVIKNLQKQAEKLEQSDLFKETGKKGQEVVPEKPEGKNLTAELLKKQFQKGE